MRVRDLNHPSRRQIRHIPTWYEERHLSNGDYHLEEGKVQGEFIGALAEESGLSRFLRVIPGSAGLQNWI